MNNRLSLSLIGAGAAILCGWGVHMPATQMGLTPTPGGAMSLICTGLPETVYSIQAATNLDPPIWVPLATNNADINGAFGFVDRNVTNYPCRFYRSAQLTGVPLGLFAKGQIVMSAGSMIDSFNSSKGPYSSANRGDNVIVMSDTNTAGAIYLSAGFIYGYAITGPGGTVATSGTSSVGDSNWIAGNIGIQPGHIATNANLQFNDITVPSFGSYNSGFTTFGNTNIAGSPGTASYYIVPAISSPDSTRPLIIYGNVTIYVTSPSGNNAVSVSGSGYIDITTNSTLTLYTAGGVTVTGNGIVNGTGLAKNFIAYGLPTCMSFVYAGAANFFGVVDAPEANFTFSGPESLYGAIVANTINLSGFSSLHYDESLAGF